MARSANQQLDSDELLHLALLANQDGKHEEAIGSLKRALALAPEDARLHYMLGAEHAQIGMYDRAVDEMQRAVDLDPALETAHFQLGLLHITSGRVDQATQAWKPLDRLGAEHPLYLFKTGLLHLAKDEFTDCDRHLRRGIAANKTNAALNNDMEKVLKEVEARLSPAATAATTEQPGARQRAVPKHVLLSAYGKNRGEEKD